MQRRHDKSIPVQLLAAGWLALLLCAASSSVASETADAPVSAVAQFTWPEPGRDLLGEVRYVTTVYEDTFARIARREGVGYNALLRLNPEVDEWLPGDGAQVTVPAMMLLPNVQRQGLVVNLSELRLYHFQPEKSRISVYPIGIGDEGRETPLMETVIVSKLQDPTWYPPPSIRARHAAQGRPLASVIPPGPDNPLGPFALQLAEKGYFIHGTNQPIGVGRRISSGCIRMYNPHITELVNRVERGEKVQVVEQPYKVGWHDGALYLEAHPTQSAQESGRSYSPFVAEIIRATRERTADIDWPLATATARAAVGLPVRISR